MKEKRKTIILLILCAMLITLGGVGFYYWYNNENFVSTEDAKVDGDFISITPQVSGKLLEFNAKEGDKDVKDQILGRLDTNGLADANIDSALLRAPTNGIIIKKETEEGQYVSAGSTLAVMIDPEKLYITANIEEIKVEKLHEGQSVDIKLINLKGNHLKVKLSI